MNLCIGQGRTRTTLDVITIDHNGWKTIDVFEGYSPDECYDVTTGLREADDSIGVIWMGDVLEHFPHARVSFVLRECRRVLQPGGRLLISVPDMIVVMSRWLKNPADYEATWLIWGEQDETNDGYNLEADSHKCGFTPSTLHAVLRGAGFTDIESMTYHGTWYELGVVATK